MAALNEPRYKVRVFHPRGRYPRARISQPEGLFWADEQIVFCVTLSMRGIPVNANVPYSEMDWLTLEELRFIGSIFLCELWDEQQLIFYPVHYYSPVINRKNLDLMKDSTAEAIRNLVIQGINGPNWGYQVAALQECLTHRYSLVEEDHVDLSRQSSIWQNIAPNDNLLLRGLSALLKSDMLSRYSEFFEEATITCFIALEASFRLILKRLTAEGAKNPNAKDAAKWLHDHFDKYLGFEAPLERYFQEFYDQRVMTLHPSSRFGEFPYAPLMIDDFYHLRSSLRSIFAYLVTGEHDRSFVEAIEKRAAGVRQ
ncbi:hypothetical protein [Nitrosospira sp. Nsp13]|uniref:hypothetical protein n=1 Tax=Nitrosospira sp. Nsp13 TaxID=1855332 RepID=UPI000883E560|nr:hypothetical protein [Nitrosospira sp. Nsp13]SCY12428.1 hypothetical protein SAMN05216308_104161 [Nitrosospira sp. Nsp13]